MNAKILVSLVAFTVLISSAIGKPKTLKNTKRRQAPMKLLPLKNPNKGCVENICNGTINYPHGYVKQALKNHPSYKELSGTAMKLFEDVEITSRWNAAEDENMCTTRQYFMLPTHAQNVNLEWKYIVQDENLKQAVHFEACSPNAKCFAGSFVPNNYKTSCKQRKVAIKLLAVSQDGSVATDHFPVPGGCVCTYKFTSGSAEAN